ncbi:MAG: 23S rRNA (adenine(2503)-C(2))-methyltransferase RlmN [Candidatus Omnitrophica bacterium]|nr:23S rRNA (adenine(2503)-C(2))-methyltransferase RlmN [Candidatus Omnitrophota bacterium]
MKDIKDYSYEELRKILEEEGFLPFYAKQIFSWIYKKRVEDFNKMTDISQSCRAFLKKNFFFSSLELVKEETSCDGTRKFLFQLDDNYRIETVVIPESKRKTLCVSTQVGCRFRCSFCVSGLTGFKRNLRVSEIVNQYLYVRDWMGKNSITNIVFMGIGEPLDNFENVVKSIRIFQNPWGIYFGKRRICVSTIGLLPKIIEFYKLNLGIKLSISLHSANSQKRLKLMPGVKDNPLEELISTLKKCSKKDKFPLTFEYIMIGGVNSSIDDAKELANLVKGWNCKINLIPYNPSRFFSWQVPSQNDIEQFKDVLKKQNVFFTLRKSKGQDILASCGQLRAESKEFD